MENPTTRDRGPQVPPLGQPGGQPSSQPSSQPSQRRVRQAPATVERLAPVAREGWMTGEQPVSMAEDLSNSQEGPLSSPQTGHLVIEPIVPLGRFRAPTAREQLTRLIFTSALLLLLIASFADAAVLAAARLVSTRFAPRWRAVPVEITSAPVGATVFIAGQAVGVTPLAVTENCRGRSIEVRVTREGYATWVWTGLCPREGSLRLHTALQQSEQSERSGQGDQGDAVR